MIKAHYTAGLPLHLQNITKMPKPLVLLLISPSTRNIFKLPLSSIASTHFELLDCLEENFEEKFPECSENIVAIMQFYDGKKITHDLLEKLPNLKFVAAISIGYENVDLKLLQSFNVKFANAGTSFADATADMGMLLLMAAGRRLLECVEFAKSPSTTRFSEKPVALLDIHSSTLGIVGMGQIGYRIAQRAKGFNMKILYNNRTRRSESEEKEVNATFYENLDAMLPLCDYVIVVVSLTPETTKMINRKRFKLMKSTAIFVNISRGGTVDQDDLVNALTSGEISFAALDVTTPQPLPYDHPLLKMPNVIITPHICGASNAARHRAIQHTVNNIQAVLEGRPLTSEINL